MTFVVRCISVPKRQKSAVADASRAVLPTPHINQTLDVAKGKIIKKVDGTS